MLYFSLKYNNQAHLNILRESDGNMIVKPEATPSSLFIFHRYDSDAHATMLALINHRHNTYGYDLHLPTGDVIRDVHPERVLNIVKAYVPRNDFGMP